MPHWTGHRFLYSQRFIFPVLLGELRSIGTSFLIFAFFAFLSPTYFHSITVLEYETLLCSRPTLSAPFLPSFLSLLELHQHSAPLFSYLKPFLYCSVNEHMIHHFRIKNNTQQNPHFKPSVPYSHLVVQVFSQLLTLGHTNMHVCVWGGNVIIYLSFLLQLFKINSKQLFYKINYVSSVLPKPPVWFYHSVVIQVDSFVLVCIPSWIPQHLC